ncbi:MAG: MBL fold metallo-hydrolase [Chitinivibrionales bacterium]|nr:MBL fold metallo-hydrolase [Chitinivibrionales bacterium]
MLITCSLMAPVMQSSSQSLVAVHRINTGSNVFILEGREKLVLVDAGYPGNGRKICRQIEKLAPKKLSLIFVTHAHFDHYGCADYIRKATGAPVGIHELDAPTMAAGKTPIPLVKSWGRAGKLLFPLGMKVWKTEPTSADMTFIEGDRLDAYGISAQVIHTPGHTDGAASLLVDDSVLFAGDLVVSVLHIGKQCYFATSWEAIDSSISKLKQLAPHRTFPGHGAAEISREELMEFK